MSHPKHSSKRRIKSDNATLAFSLQSRFRVNIAIMKPSEIVDSDVAQPLSAVVFCGLTGLQMLKLLMLKVLILVLPVEIAVLPETCRRCTGWLV